MTEAKQVCISNCVKKDFLTGLGTAQGSCSGDAFCAPCKNPLTGAATGYGAIYSRVTGAPSRKPAPSERSLNSARSKVAVIERPRAFSIIHWPTPWTILVRSGAFARFAPLASARFHRCVA